MSSNNFKDNKFIYLSEIKGKHISIYWFIILFLSACFSSLPFINVDVSLKSQGIIRPKNERTVLKSSISTTIDSIYHKEGDVIKEGEIIIQLRKENNVIKKTMNDFEINQRILYINDLAILTSNINFTDATISNIKSPVYKQQTSHFVYQLSELNEQLKKVKNELLMDSILSVNRVIAPKEMFDKQIENEKLLANIRATREQQLAAWQGELARYQLEKSQYQNSNQQLTEDDNSYSIKAPISGVLQNFNKYYKGSLIQAGDEIAVISPETELIAECYVNTRDIGLLSQNQQIIFQIDAFDYNYFGILTGRIKWIDNDYTVMDNKPVFRVGCILDEKQLHLKNGFAGYLKKGMTLQARFVVARRTLWQLLFDKIDDWVNPNAPTKQN